MGTGCCKHNEGLLWKECGLEMLTQITVTQKWLIKITIKIIKTITIKTTITISRMEFGISAKC